MNDIAKKATADKFLRALEKEGLSKAEAGASIGFTATQVSYLFNEKYWPRLGVSYWDIVLSWVNSGQSLKEYAEKHGKVLTPDKKNMELPLKVIEVKTVKKDPEFEPVDFTSEIKDKIENTAKLVKHPYFSGAEEKFQKLRIDIEINLIINGKKITL
ncbi:MAG: hypothetical protein LLG05_06620 [Porphyromonadaceae bacterium]|nr:hypothetical protein [Porphyromonadaceae bacterium]